MNKEIYSIPKKISITEDIILDPYCIGDYSLELSNDRCDRRGNFSELRLGTSFNLEDYNKIGNLPFEHILTTSGQDFNSEKLLFLKIRLPEIPHTGILKNVEITKADLQLYTRYTGKTQIFPDTQTFSILGGVCKNSNWNEQTNMIDLPCISKWKYSTANEQTFFQIVEPSRLSKIPLDLSSHVEYALDNNLKDFTEIVEFNPIIINSINRYDVKTLKCLHNSLGNKTNFENCLNDENITVFSSDYPSKFSGLWPALYLEYSVQPTLFTTVAYDGLLSGLAIGLPVFIMLFWTRLLDKKKMKTACESILKEIEDTRDILKEHPKDGKLLNQFVVQYDEDEKLKIKFKGKFNNEILFSDAYDGIKNSGLLNNIRKEYLLTIIETYNRIIDYNKNLVKLGDISQKAKLDLNKQSSKEIKWKYESELKIYAEHLGKLRNGILDNITGSGNNMIKILNDEISRFS